MLLILSDSNSPHAFFQLVSLNLFVNNALISEHCLIFLSLMHLIFYMILRFFSRVHATLQPALSVGQSVGWSVGHTLLFFYDFISLTSLLLPKWSGDLKNGPCPPARDFGSRVSGLVS